MAYIMTEKSATISASSACVQFSMGLIFQSQSTQKPIAKIFSSEKLYSIIFLRTKFAFISKCQAVTMRPEEKKWTMDFVGIRISRTSNFRRSKKKIKSSRYLCDETIHFGFWNVRTRTFVITISAITLSFSVKKTHSVELCKSALTTSWLLLLSVRYFFFCFVLFRLLLFAIRNCWHIWRT